MAQPGPVWELGREPWHPGRTPARAGWGETRGAPTNFTALILTSSPAAISLAFLALQGSLFRSSVQKSGAVVIPAMQFAGCIVEPRVGGQKEKWQPQSGCGLGVLQVLACFPAKPSLLTFQSPPCAVLRLDNCVHRKTESIVPVQ